MDVNTFENIIKASMGIKDELKEQEEVLYTCPQCGELVEELIDTEGMLNGGIGKVCHQCIEDYDIGN